MQKIKEFISGLFNLIKTKKPIEPKQRANTQELVAKQDETEKINEEMLKFIITSTLAFIQKNPTVQNQIKSQLLNIIANNNANPEIYKTLGSILLDTIRKNEELKIYFTTTILNDQTVLQRIYEIINVNVISQAYLIQELLTMNTQPLKQTETLPAENNSSQKTIKIQLSNTTQTVDNTTRNGIIISCLTTMFLWSSFWVSPIVSIAKAVALDWVLQILFSKQNTPSFYEHITLISILHGIILFCMIILS